ncbi:MAG: hypothetical protein JXM70_29745 [Pirellulales bacterium]|nr:hypothetical protein [Pirellulales bacterium]
MNDSTERELMVIVERAVRPVRASVSRKRRMREELLEHLAAVFESEMEQNTDIQAGMERARRRFGDPAKLTEELQQAVPWWDRANYICDIARLEPGDSLIHFFARLAVMVMTIFFAVMLALWLVVLPAWIAEGKFGRETLFVATGIWIVGMFFVVFPFIFISVAKRTGRALYGEPGQRSKWLAVRWILAAMLVFLPLFFWTFAIFINTSGWGVAAFWFTCFLSLTFSLILLYFSRQSSDAQWANLELEN